MNSGKLVFFFFKLTSYFLEQPAPNAAQPCLHSVLVTLHGLAN